jgi:hypothetical protein
MIRIPTNLLAAVAKWASTDESRPHLCMVLFTKGEYVACDGHRLVRVPLEYDGPAFGVDRRHLLAAVTAQRELRGGREIEIKLDDARVVLTIAEGVRMAVPTRDASKYPPYEQVMPAGKPDKLPEPYGFNPKYLAAIYEVDQASRPDSTNGVKIAAWGGSLDAMMFTNTDGIRFVVMPVRT